MTRRFMRKAVVQINDTVYRSYTPLNDGRGGIDPRGHRIDFEVEQGLKNGPDKATVVVYNPDLQQAQRLVLAKGRTFVQLFAGYDVPPSRYAVGRTIKDGVALEWNGTDYVLRLQFADGIKTYQTGRVAVSAGAGARMSDVIADISKQLGLSVGSLDLGADLALPRGYTAFGTARQTLDEIARATNSDWTVQGDKLVFLGRAKAAARVGRVFSKFNGSLFAPPSPKGAGKWSFELDWEPTMRPGALFKVDAGIDLGSGFFKATSVRASGSSFSGEFKMTVEARALNI